MKHYFKENIKGKEIEYEYYNNKSDRLVIVFSCVMTDLKTFKLLLRDEEKAKEYKGEKKLHFYSLKDNYKDVDYLYIYDNNSLVDGWYLYDNQENISEKYIEFLEAFINRKHYQKENVVSYGGSKGGTAALFYGLNCDSIGRCVSITPQIDLVNFVDDEIVQTDYIRTIFYNKFLFGNNESFKNETRNIFYECEYKQCEIELYTGIFDCSYTDQMKYADFLLTKGIKLNLHIYDDIKDHKQLFMYYLKEGIEKIK